MKEFNYYTSAIKDSYAKFDGRANRSEFWYFVLFNFIISLVIGFVAGMIHLSILGTIYSLAVLVPGIAIGVRRMHDINKSGWWVLIGLIPLIGWIWFIVLAATKGTEGENDFGAESKA